MNKQELQTESRLSNDELLASDLPLQGLPEQYTPFHDCFLFDRFGNRQYDKVYFLAIDTEWYPDGGRNCIISYQLATVSTVNAVNRIIYVRAGERLTFIEAIESGIANLHGGTVPTEFRAGDPRVLIVVIAHNFVAEWSALKDRDSEAIVNKLSPIRKCPVTGLKPIELFSPLLGNVAVHIYDTMLLAPVGFQSLDKLSSLLGEEDSRKIDISQFYKENMNLFLAEDPDGFEEYALRDTELTIKLFVVLQTALNDLAYGEIKQVFKTLASAAVKGFQVTHPNFKSYRRALKKEKFNGAYKLIMRSYHGGRNEGFLIGDSRD